MCTIQDVTLPEPSADPILISVRKALDEMYGNRIERVVLFGSRARGDATEESDYDIAVFLHDMADRWNEFDRLADLRVKFIDDMDAFLDVKPYLANAYEQRTPLMREVRSDGIDL